MTLIEHAFQPGVFYDIEIKVKKHATEGIEIGLLIYAMGNLVYEDEEYKPASNQGEYGDYWYKNSARKYLDKPMKDQKVLNIPSKFEGKPKDDICNKLGTGWREPSPADAENLKQFAAWDQQYQPGGKKKFVEGNYKTPRGLVKGLYFGTGAVPNPSDQDKYLFLPYAGMYNSGIPSSLGTTGAYWHSGKMVTLGFRTNLQGIISLLTMEVGQMC